MFVASILVSALLFGSLGSGLGRKCSTMWGIKDTSFLIEKLQDDCTTPCFQEGLSQVTNATQKSKFFVLFNRVKRTVEGLKKSKCPFFSCEKPCNETTTGNTLSFLKSLQGTFQKAEVSAPRHRA
ncbi:hypothetical protein STEG23_020781 [Scotinomys teguina]